MCLQRTLVYVIYLINVTYCVTLRLKPFAIGVFTAHSGGAIGDSSQE